MKKSLFFVIIAALLLCGCFVSCNKSGNDATLTEGESTGDIEAEVTPEPDAVFNVSELYKYTAIRFDDATSSEKKLFTEFLSELNVALGVEIESKSDFLFKNEQAAELEILFGETVREESAEIYKELKYNDYVITVVGSKIVIAGGSDESLASAADKFLSFIKDGKLTIPSSRFEYNAEYRYPEMKLDGVSISEYRVIYGVSSQLETANVIRDAVGKASGVRLSVLAHTKSEKAEREIVVGTTNRYKHESCPYYSYNAFSETNSIYINAYDQYALTEAAYAMAEKIETLGGELTLEDLCVSYELPDYTEYIEDIDKLYMRWGRIWQPDEKMLDYEAKLDAFRNTSGKLLSCAHRAECYYYPENSIESIISFYKMGGDVVELDIQPTRDGVLILMHDSTLKRMTNWSEFAGKTIDGITFPQSSTVSAWTYEQLQYLSLKESDGGADAALTPFKIPTLVEALKVCKNRLLIIPDKSTTWNYIPKDNGMSDVFSCMKEADNYESIILSYGLRASTGAEVQKYIFDNSGVMPFLLIRDNNDPLENVYKPLSETVKAGSFGVQVEGRFLKDSFPEKFKATYEALRGKVLMWGLTISDEANGYSDENDGKETWDIMYDLGYRMIMTNHYLELVQYASEKSK